MAEDTNNNSPSSEINEDKPKDHSDKEPLTAKKRVVKVPHYLRASTGSCHDACKYGKPHVFKEKPWRAVRRMLAPLPKTEKTVEIQIFVGRKVKKTVGVDNLEHSPSDRASAIDTLKKSYLSARKSPLHDSSKFVKPEGSPLMKSPSHTPKVMKKSIQSPWRSSLPDILKLSKQEGASASKKDVILKLTPSVPKVRSVSAGPVRPNRTSVMPSISPDVVKASRGKPATETKFSDHPRSSSVTIRKVLTPSATTLSISPDVVKASRGKPATETKFSDHPRSSSVTVRKVVLTPSATTLSVKRSPKLDVKKPSNPSEATTPLSTSAVKAVKSYNIRKTNGITIGQNDQTQRSRVSATNRVTRNKAELKKTNNDMAEEKTLHMIEIKKDHLPITPISTHFIPSPSPLSPESLNSSAQTNSLSITSQEVELCSTDSDADDSISNYNVSRDSKYGKRNTRNSGLDQDPTALKLKFRRGKVVELNSETNSSRRLRFKQGARLGDDQVVNSGSKRKSFKKRAVDSDKEEVSSDQVKVALKHQEQVAKDEQVLYNNVIEETASKLVEKRKSKVKALVGAFETVISLQERKPAATKK